MSHHIFIHAYEPVTRIDIPIGAYCKRISHTIGESADISPPRKDTPDEVVDVHDIHVIDMLKGFVGWNTEVHRIPGGETHLPDPYSGATAVQGAVS